MKLVTPDQARAIYKQAIEPASDQEDPAWWAAVIEEVRQVVDARSYSAGAAVISWWHHDWSTVNDPPVAASKRIRAAARDFFH